MPRDQLVIENVEARRRKTWETFDDAYHNGCKTQSGLLSLLFIAVFALPLASVFIFLVKVAKKGIPVSLILTGSICLALMVVNLFALIFLFVFTNDASLSSMLAQRWNPISYISSQTIAAMLWFIIGVICMSGSSSSSNIDAWKPIVGSLSLTLIGCGLLIPGQLPATRVDLGFPPEGTVRFADIIDDRDPQLSPRLYPCCGDSQMTTSCFGMCLKFDTASNAVHHTLNFLGGVMGVVLMVNFCFSFVGKNADHENVIAVMCDLASVVLTSFAFMVTKRDNRAELGKRVRLLTEFMFIFSLASGVLITILSESGVIQGFTTP